MSTRNAGVTRSRAIVRGLVAGGVRTAAMDVPLFVRYRVSIAFNWTVASLCRGRPQRAITTQAIARREA